MLLSAELSYAQGTEAAAECLQQALAENKSFKKIVTVGPCLGDTADLAVV
jgi:hypothetical protein